MKRLLTTLLILAAAATALPAQAADYLIDAQNAHAFITFRINHLGYSWVMGRFDHFNGSFVYDDKKPNDSSVKVSIDVNSIDTNNSLRDKHLRSEEFFYVSKYPTAKFVSTSYTEQANGKAVLKGNLTLRGITKPITIAVEQVGHGPDPWGGYRRGFLGTTTIKLKDFGIPFNLGPASTEAELTLSVEGIRQ